MVSVLDQERRCARCKERAATVIFDREQVCAACYKILADALEKERWAHVRLKTARQ